MLEFSREMAEFIKVNFDKNIFDKRFLEEMRHVALIGREKSYIDSLESKILLLNDFNTCASYDGEKIRIFVFNKLLQYLLYIKKCKIKLNLDTLKLFNYVGLLHEIMHSYQLDVLINDKSDDTLATIIKHSMIVSGGDLELSGKKILSHHEKMALKLYQRNYSLFPEERQAQLSALYFVLQVYRELKPQNISVLYDFYKTLIYYGVREYTFKDKVSCPLLRFYNIIDRVDLFYKLDFDYSLKDKFIYGMPLTREELYNVCYPFIMYNDDGMIFFEKESIARKMWVKKYVK